MKGNVKMRMLKLLAVAFPITILLGWFASEGGDAAVILVLFIGFVMFVVSKAMAIKRKRLMEMIDGESGKTTSDAMHKTDAMPVLVDGVVVYEAKAMASSLEAAAVRFRVERTDEDRSFVYGGHGGLGTRMRIRVHGDDFERASNILKRRYYADHELE